MGQAIGINNSGAPGHASSILDLSSTTKGLLIPRMTEAQRGAISSPAAGLMVFQTDGTSGFYYYDGSWKRTATSENASYTAGTGISVSSNVISLTDMPALSIKGNATNAASAPTDITGVTNGHVLRISGTTLGFGTIIAAGIASNAITTAKISNSNVTYAKIQNVTASSLLGNPTGLAAAPSEITLGTGLSFSGTTLNSSGGTVTTVSGTSPINVSNGTTTPAISIADADANGSTKGAASFTTADFNATTGNISIDYTNGQKATSSVPGFLTSADWTTFNNKQAPMSAGTGISISSNTITNSAPDQTVALTAGTGISVSGTYPNFTITNSSPSSGGTVTSVGLSLPSIFSVSGSPVTGSGTLSGSLATQTANTIFAGPTTGAAATPTFRSLVAADIPGGSSSYIQNGTAQQSNSDFNISGNGTIGGRLILTGGTISTAAMTGTNDLGLYSLSNGSWLRMVTNQAPIKFFSDANVNNAGSSPNFTIESNGNVGVGVPDAATPQAKFDVRGGAIIGELSSGGYYNSNAVLHLRKTDAPHLILEDAGNNTAALSTDGNGLYMGTESTRNIYFKTGFTNSGSLMSTGTTQMFIDGTNSRVGIGTTLPSSRLHVEVPADKDNNPADNGIYVYNSGNAGDNDDAIITARVNGANAGDPFFSMDVNGVTGWSMGIDNSDGDKFKIANNWSDPGNTSRLTIDGSGNVGIGTTSPGTRLNVVGKSLFSRDNQTECCGSDETIAIAEASNSTGRQASISFHNAGEAESFIRLAGGGSGARSGQRRLIIGDN